MTRCCVVPTGCTAHHHSPTPDVWAADGRRAVCHTLPVDVAQGSGVTTVRTAHVCACVPPLLYRRYGGQKLDALFSQWDQNGDGRLTDEEFKVAVKRLTPLTGREMKAVLAALDEDGDGTVDKNEFFRFVRTDKDVRRDMRCVGPTAMVGLWASAGCLPESSTVCVCVHELVHGLRPSIVDLTLTCSRAGEPTSALPPPPSSGVVQVRGHGQDDAAQAQGTRVPEAHQHGFSLGSRRCLVVVCSMSVKNPHRPRQPNMCERTAAVK